MFMKTSNPEETIDDLRQFCFQIPKIELHAHLNGCIRSSTFRQLLSSSNDRERLDTLDKHLHHGDSHTRMKNVFEKFALLRSCVTNLETIDRITRETLEDFHRDQVVYVELRTRPRSFDNGRISAELYIETILNVMNEFDEKIRSRLILSVDRTQTVEQAMETLKLAEKYRSMVVGLDLSGDPNVKSFERLRPVFDLAKQSNISTTIHIGELPDDECLKENDAIIDYQPTRLGHFNFRTGDQEQRVISKSIPLEICPTSNILTMNLSTLNDHHFQRFYSHQHPLAICTDDSGLMDCSLSSEIFDIAESFQLKRKELYQLMFQTSNLIFDRTTIDFCQNKLKNFIDLF